MAEENKTQNHVDDPLSQPQVIGQIMAAHIKAQSLFASLVLRGCFILNGTVGIAAFTSGAGSLLPVCLCGFGAVLAIIGAGFAYRVQGISAKIDGQYFRMKLYPDKQDTFSIVISRKQQNARNWVRACVIVCIFSLLLFVAALVCVIFLPAH